MTYTQNCRALQYMRFMSVVILINHELFLTELHKGPMGTSHKEKINIKFPISFPFQLNLWGNIDNTGIMTQSRVLLSH
jgi:hypothetical protein